MNIDALCDWGERTQPTKLRLQGRRVGNEVAGKGSHGRSVLFGVSAFRSPASHIPIFFRNFRFHWGKGQDLTPVFDTGFCIFKFVQIFIKFKENHGNKNGLKGP